jgi:hypothetical protein
MCIFQPFTILGLSVLRIFSFRVTWSKPSLPAFIFGTVFMCLRPWYEPNAATVENKVTRIYWKGRLFKENRRRETVFRGGILDEKGYRFPDNYHPSHIMKHQESCFDFRIVGPVSYFTF